MAFLFKNPWFVTRESWFVTLPVRIKNVNLSPSAHFVRSGYTPGKDLGF